MKETYTSSPRLLYVATQLFLKQGFVATSIDQICRTTGVSKGAFFHYYKSKDAAGESAIEYYWTLLDAYLFSGLESSSPRGRLERVSERMRELPDHLHFENGSLLAVFAVEATPEQEGIRKQLSATYKMWAEKLADALSATGRTPQESLGLAQLWIATYEGLSAQAKLLKDKQLVRARLLQFEELSHLQ